MTNSEPGSANSPNTSICEIHEFLRVLASETKRRLLFEVFKGGAEHTVGEVAAIAGIGLSTASESLAEMRRAGILKSRRIHKEVHYQADQTLLLSHLERLITAISSCCCSQETCSPPSADTQTGTA